MSPISTSAGGQNYESSDEEDELEPSLREVLEIRASRGGGSGGLGGTSAGHNPKYLQDDNTNGRNTSTTAGKTSKNDELLAPNAGEMSRSEIALDDSSVMDVVRMRASNNANYNEDLKRKLEANGITLESLVEKKATSSKNDMLETGEISVSEVALDDSSLLEFVRRRAGNTSTSVGDDNSNNPSQSLYYNQDLRQKLESNGITLESPTEGKATSTRILPSGSNSPPVVKAGVPGAYPVAPSRMFLNNTSSPGQTQQSDDANAGEISSSQPMTDNALQMQEEGQWLPEPTSNNFDEPPDSGLSEAFAIDEDGERENLAAAIEVDQEAGKERKKREDWLSLSLLANGFLLLAVIVLVAIIIVRDSSCDCSNEVAATTGGPSPSPTSAPSTHKEYILSLLPDQTVLALDDTDSPQYLAYKWLLNDPSVDNYSDMRLVQRFSLATLFFATKGGDWLEVAKEGWLSYSLHECDWNFTSDTPYAFNDAYWNPHYPMPENPCGTQALESNSTQNDDLQYQYLWLPEAGLEGDQIPVEIFLLTSLKTLNLAANHISGTIPSETGKLTNLEVLSLSLNPLSGSLPSEIGLCSNLSALLFEGQPRLAGSIFSEIGKLTKLEHLYLNNVGLSGPVPSEMGLLQSIQSIDLANSGLNGSIPTELSQLTSLWSFGISNNHLSGRLPSEIALLTSLEMLSLANNTLEGSVPTQLGGLSSLHTVSLRYNFLTGKIPSEFGRLESLSLLHMYENFLTGNLPTELGNIHGMEVLWLYDNSLSGTMPSEMGLMTYLYDLKLQDNQITGSLPTEVGSLVHMEDLQLQRNELSGVLPSEAGALSMMYLLSLQGNQLFGQIPTEMGRLGSMEVLILSDNSFSGALPSQMGLLSNLAYLDIADNGFTGEVPEELSSLLPNPHLEGFNLKGNSFAGELSGEFCTVDDSLFQFDCSNVLCGCSCSCHNNSNLAKENNTNH